MAKTQYSFSADPSLRGAPIGHIVPVREVRLSAGAGFIVVICGDYDYAWPARVPAAQSIGLDADGQIEGCSDSPPPASWISRRRQVSLLSMTLMKNKPISDACELTPITSAANAEVKLLRSLHERKYRRKTGWFLAEGMRICMEALQLGHAPVRIVYAAGREAEPGLSTLIAACQNQVGAFCL